MSKFLEWVNEFAQTPTQQIIVDEGFNSEEELEVSLRTLFLNMSDYQYIHTIGEKGVNRQLNLIENEPIQIGKFDGIEEDLTIGVFEPVFENEEEKLQDLYRVREAEEKDSEVIRGSFPTPSELKKWNNILAHEGLGLI